MGNIRDLSFDEWYWSLTELADRRGLIDLIGDEEDHNNSHVGGLTPAEELKRLIAANPNHRGRNVPAQ